MTTIGDLLSEFKEKPRPGESPPVLTLTEHNGFVRQADRFKKRLALEDTSGYKVVRRNDIAFNPYLLWAGAVAQNTIVDAGVISPLYPTFRVKDGFDASYIARLLLTPEVVSAYDRIAFGSVPRRRRSSVQDFLNLEVGNVPSLQEQRRIAAILDQADAIRAKRRQVLARLDALTQALLAEVVSGIEARVPFGEAVSEFRYGTSAKSGPSGYPALRIPNVIGSTLDLSDIKTVDVTEAELGRLRLEGRDLLFVRSNGNPENVGRCAVFEPELVSRLAHRPDQWIYASYLIRARIGVDFDSTFLAAYMASAEARRQLRDAARTSAGQFNINIEGLKTIQIPDVSLQEQARFSAGNAAVRELAKKHARVDAAQERLFASLQSRAFKGEL